MTSKNAPLMIFDLDGTLVDSARDLIPVLNIILERQGLKTVKMSEARNVIGFGAKAMISKAYSLNQTPIDDDLLDELFNQFLKEYEGHCTKETIFFDGVLALLDRLESEGWQFAICTNKLEYLAKRIIEGFHATHRFKCICGPDTFGVKKPDPEHIFKTIKMAGGDVENSIMIGDAEPDAHAAKSANIPVLLADFGYSNVDVKTLPNDGIYSHFNEIYDLLKSIKTDWH